MTTLDQLRRDFQKLARIQKRIDEIDQTLRTAPAVRISDAKVKTSPADAQQEQIVKLIDLKCQKTAEAIKLQVKLETVYAVMEERLSDREYIIMSEYISGKEVRDIAEEIKYSDSGVRKALERASVKVLEKVPKKTTS